MQTNVHIIRSDVEWDPEKAISNLRKHGIDFADAVSALGDDLAVTIPDDFPDERRFVTVGMDALDRVLVAGLRLGQHRIALNDGRDPPRPVTFVVHSHHPRMAAHPRTFRVRDLGGKHGDEKGRVIANRGEGRRDQMADGAEVLRT